MSTSSEKCVGILVEIGLNLLIAFGGMVVHGAFFHCLVSSVYCLKVFEFISYKSFICLIRVILGYLLMLLGKVTFS